MFGFLAILFKLVGAYIAGNGVFEATGQETVAVIVGALHFVAISAIFGNGFFAVLFSIATSQAIKKMCKEGF